MGRNPVEPTARESGLARAAGESLSAGTGCGDGRGGGMCRNIKPLFDFDPPASEAEIREASLQFVRKISGFRRPSRINEKAFNRGVDEVTAAAGSLLESLVTDAEPRDRESEAVRARLRAGARFRSIPASVHHDASDH